MTTKEASLILETTTRHAARLARMVGLHSRGRGIKLDWSWEQLHAAGRILEKRERGRGRFTVGQER